MGVLEQLLPGLVLGLHLVHAKGMQQIRKELSRYLALAHRLVERDEDRVNGLFRRVVALIEHRSPGIQQAHRHRWIVHLVAEIVRDPAISIDALEVRPYIARKKPRRHMKVLVVSGCQMAAPLLRLFERGPFERCQILKRSSQQRMLGHAYLAHFGTPSGKTAVLIPPEPPLRSIMRAKTAGTSSNSTRSVMYSAHLNRPLVTRSKAVRQVAGV